MPYNSLFRLLFLDCKLQVGHYSGLQTIHCNNKGVGGHRLLRGISWHKIFLFCSSRVQDCTTINSITIAMETLGIRLGLPCMWSLCNRSPLQRPQQCGNRRLAELTLECSSRFPFRIVDVLVSDVYLHPNSVPNPYSQAPQTLSLQTRQGP